MSLTRYNKKRNFNRTNEPVGKIKKSSNKLKFVVQHHFSRKEHYDLRLEYNGVYVSFAVPKGPSYNRNDKRLAVHVEDQGEQITVETSEGIKFNLDEDALAGLMSSLECLRDERYIKRGTYRNLFSCLSFSEQFIY